ncbi:unnamed protein product [Caenorhabditis nigoni]
MEGHNFPIFENKPAHPCPTCGRQFTTLSNRKRHIVENHGVGERKIHKCELCPKTFVRNDQLKVHQEHVHKFPIVRQKRSSVKLDAFVVDGKYHCLYCERTFARKDYHTRHVKRRHSEMISKEVDESNKETTTAPSPELVPNLSQILFNLLPDSSEIPAPNQEENEAPTTK